MSYEFNPENSTFEFPNPYKVENLSLIISGVFMLLAGGSIMLTVREHLAHGVNGRVLAAIAISIALLVCGIGVLARAFSQLRFFFGRNRPESLAPLVPNDHDGSSAAANELKETLRQNAVTVREPHGALNGLLYSWLPHLIFAPEVIQRAAQGQFYKFLALLATLASFLVCWLLFGRGPASGWIGLAYAAFAVPQILHQQARQAPTAAADASVGSRSLVLLVVLALLGPVILGVFGARLPALGELAINTALAVALLCALAGCAVFGIALKMQLQPAPQAVGSARVMETVTMNAHPNKLIEELDRILMAGWFSRIPNRRYARRSPVISGQQGQFVAEIFEESQPRPQPNRTAAGVGHALSTPQFRWLAILTGLAMLYLAIGTLAAVLLSHEILAGNAVTTTAAFALSQIAVGLFCFRAAHVLWGRFDFISELIWVDLSGSFESAHVNVGNQFAGSVQSGKSVINIESMTMRVWVSEIDTVIFGKDAARQLIGMRGLQQNADELAGALKNFGESRAMIVAPTAPADVERAAQIAAMQQVASGQLGSQPGDQVDAPATAAALLAASAASPASEPVPPARAQFCTGCGSALGAGARFCSGCGQAVAS